MLRFQSPHLTLKKFRYTNPLHVPQRRLLWRELPVSRAFVYMSLEFLLKFLLIKEIYPSSQRP